MAAAVDNNLFDALQQLLPGDRLSCAPDQLAGAASTNPALGAVTPPMCIACPADVDQLQSLIHFANERGVSLAVTASQGAHRQGGLASQEAHILIDLSHWRKIDLIDRRNRVCRIQPGVTYRQLLDALAEHGLSVPLPLAPREGKSVLAAVLDRTPSTWPNKQWDSSDPLGSTEFFFGSGERFRSGAGGGPGTLEEQRRSGGAQKFSSGPSQTDFQRLVQGAQGTMGIVSWITLRAELLPSLQQELLVGSHRLADLLPFVYAVQRGLLGEQSFLLNRTAAALLMAGSEAGLFETLRANLPSWLCLQVVAGFERLPRERLDYHLLEIGGFARQHDLRLEARLGPLAAADLFAKAAQPCGERDWRDALRGGSLSLFCLSTLDRTPELVEVFMRNAQEAGISEAEVGVYLQPIVQNHACHIEFILPFEPGSNAEVQRMKTVERQAVVRLLAAGAFFSRPYGSAAELVWAQNPGNYQLLKTVKAIFDPQRVLQRGKWGL